MSFSRKVSVLGMGYVGLPVAVAFSSKCRVIGFDINETRILALQDGIDYTKEVEGSVLSEADIFFTSEQGCLAEADFHIIAVPTPIDQSKRPDLGPVISASEIIASVLKPGDIIVYESTVYPGATEEECLPILENISGMKAGEDFYIGYSPERINPGDKQHSFTSIKKVVSAQQPQILDVIANVYGAVVTAGIHKAPSIKVAEAAKVIENTQRDINISLMNELAIIFDRLNIDTGDVLEAAGTKWNFLPFKPGLVGGHCIGVDPYYLTHKAELTGYSPEIILAGRRINDGMGGFITSKVIEKLANNGLPVNNLIVTILGFTFKENVPDIRNTRAIDMVRSMEEHNVTVQVHDPIADTNITFEEYGVKLLNLEELQPANAIIFAVAHSDYDKLEWKIIQKLLVNGIGVVFDVQGMLNRDQVPEDIHLLRL